MLAAHGAVLAPHTATQKDRFKAASVIWVVVNQGVTASKLCQHCKSRRDCQQVPENAHGVCLTADTHRASGCAAPARQTARRFPFSQPAAALNG